MSRLFVLLVSVLSVMVLPALPAGAAPGHAGYWACRGTTWVAVGSPAHPRPLKACGETIEVPEDRTACLKAGGTWARGGLSPVLICKMPLPDAGRTCGDSGECLGDCLGDRDRVKAARKAGRSLAMTGQCSAVKPLFGCLAIIRRGQAGGVLCRD